MDIMVVMIAIFLLGIIMIALEDKIHINKAATALMMAVAMWMIDALYGNFDSISEPFVRQLGETSETLFFVLGALAIIELVDAHGGFRIITNTIKTTKKRKLLWIVSFLTFILSALLDNIATAVIMISLLRKIVPHKTERLIYACMIILAANAGGSFSPIGDVTTILLWTKGNISPEHQIPTLILPALACMIVPLIFVTRFFKRGSTWGEKLQIHVENEQLPDISSISRFIILFLGISTMVSVASFNEWTGLPPFMRIMMGLAMLWMYTDIMYGRRKPHATQVQDDNASTVKLPVADVLRRIDMSTILFFLGILMSVGAMNEAGILTNLGQFLENTIPDPLGIAFVIGVMSSFVDNVALVAATQGMYPIAEVGTYAANSPFWTFLAYCAVTGGSLLIIGSATGVTVMGMEKVSFTYYLRKFSLLALCGYIAGAAVYLLIA